MSPKRTAQTIERKSMKFVELPERTITTNWPIYWRTNKYQICLKYLVSFMSCHWNSHKSIHTYCKHSYANTQVLIHTTTDNIEKIQHDHQNSLRHRYSRTDLCISKPYPWKQKNNIIYQCLWCIKNAKQISTTILARFKNINYV